MEKLLNEKTVFRGTLSGHLLLILSGISYSIYWILNFGLQGNIAAQFAGIFIAGSLLSGLTGILILIEFIRQLSAPLIDKKFKISHIVLICLVFFILNLTITIWGFKRFFTSELFLIILWAALELSATGVFYHNKWLSKLQIQLSVFFIILSTIIGIACYTIHYNLNGWIQFVNGLIPYIMISIVMMIICGFLLFNKNFNT